ncbi:MAG: hypothetical protein WB491_04230, partial [Candidatus Aquilonibacter sp.]
GLGALETFATDARMVNYQPYWAARADMLARCDEVEQARTAYERALGLTIDPAVREYLTSRREELRNANDVARK